jgi:uncharacterized protein YdcH (DUF465 family)
MRVLSTILIALFLVPVSPALAQRSQLSKEERREARDLIRDYRRNPQVLLSLEQEQERLIQETSVLRDQIKTLENNQLSLNNEVTRLREENNQLNGLLATAQESIRQLTEERAQLVEREPGPSVLPMEGTIYRVQIGAFRRARLPEVYQGVDNMMIEEEDGFQKVLVGNFRDFEDARQLMQDLKRMGVRGAWVVPYVNGRRTTLKEAMGVREQQ